MSAPEAKSLYTIEEYLAMERASEVKHEYLDGKIIGFDGDLPNKGKICVNLIGEIGCKLENSRFEMFAKHTRVYSGSAPNPIWLPKGLFSYPDVVIVCGDAKYHDQYRDVLLNPKVIIEVLSEGTAEFDYSEKFRRYREWLPSLEDYILVSSLEILIEHFRKQPNGDWLLTTIKNLDALLKLESVGCEVRLSDVYARVSFEPNDPEMA
ncbi:MAG: Uma2 family endonuclease [Acidobacteriota bacterium]|nr:Uma2 family endonuclease [Acidobacteriota bacterium]